MANHFGENKLTSSLQKGESTFLKISICRRPKFVRIARSFYVNKYKDQSKIISIGDFRYYYYVIISKIIIEVPKHLAQKNKKYQFSCTTCMLAFGT